MVRNVCVIPETWRLHCLSTGRASSGLAEEGLAHAGLRASGVFVPVVESRFPIPDGPADSGLLGSLTECLVVMSARGVDRPW